MLFFGKDWDLKSTKTFNIKEYFSERLHQGAAIGTVSKEKSALSLLFNILIEYEQLDTNPVKGTRLPVDRSRREVFLSSDDFDRICRGLPSWARPIAQILYYTGARRGEIINLTWNNIDLTRRLITLSALETKEGKPKRIPLRHEAINVLTELRGQSKIAPISGHVFHCEGRPACRWSFSRAWRKTVRALGFFPVPVVHDLRHVWKINALRSGMDFEIRETIMGHSTTRTIYGRYGRISDDDLVRAMDSMTFGKGETEILVTTHRTSETTQKKCEQNANKRGTAIMLAKDIKTSYG